ncbi:MAG: hypothetical protein HWQ38_16030 [Nostoc sp. NMS7]|uniref:hypothetical protein n=1 Tax=Nostoc sp. NMS7 TaxID=2815391 RepID=UPI0025EB4635|nr:hypothetical protein [Nostoc sp. NMS7]MBN3947881.1 hypothetical protein [Nostoc sp. NMS7]
MTIQFSISNNKTSKKTLAFSDTPAQRMFESHPFVVQSKNDNSEKPDLKASLIQAEKYGHHLSKKNLANQSVSTAVQPKLDNQPVQFTDKRKDPPTSSDGGNPSKKSKSDSQLVDLLASSSAVTSQPPNLLASSSAVTSQPPNLPASSSAVGNTTRVLPFTELKVYNTKKGKLDRPAKPSAMSGLKDVDDKPLSAHHKFPFNKIREAVRKASSSPQLSQIIYDWVDPEGIIDRDNIQKSDVAWPAHNIHMGPAP